MTSLPDGSIISHSNTGVNKLTTNMTGDKKSVNSLAIRVIVIEEAKVLVVRQKKPNGRYVHILPGGGIETKEDMFSAAEREVQEETRLKIKSQKLLYLKEIIDPYRHGYEFYVLGKIRGGRLKLGHDPEKSGSKQILKKVYFAPLESLEKINFFPQELRTQLRKDWEKKFKNINTYLGCQIISPALHKRLFGGEINESS